MRIQLFFNIIRIHSIARLQKDEILKYYVVADTHGYYNEMVEALTEKGYYADTTPHKLIMCGDLFDRGSQNKEIEKFVLDLWPDFWGIDEQDCFIS